MRPTNGESRRGWAGHATGLVRDDPSGLLAEQLSRETSRARVLLAGAHAIADDVSLDDWRDEYMAWRTGCGAMLSSRFQREAAEEFYAGTQVREYPRGSWRDARAEAVKSVQDMIELLAMLRNTLAPPRGGSAQVRRSPGEATTKQEPPRQGLPEDAA